MPKQPEACDATQSLLMLLREAHEMLDMIGCSPEGIEKTKAAAVSLQGRIDDAIESAGKPTWWPAHGKDASDTNDSWKVCPKHGPANDVAWACPSCAMEISDEYYALIATLPLQSQK